MSSELRRSTTRQSVSSSHRSRADSNPRTPTTPLSPPPLTPPSQLHHTGRQSTTATLVNGHGLQFEAPILSPRLQSGNVSSSSGRPRSASRGSQGAHQNYHASHHVGVVERLEEGLTEAAEDFEHAVSKGKELADLFVEPKVYSNLHLRGRELWNRFRGKEHKWIGWRESLSNVVQSSVLNFFLICIPFAWVSHFHWKIVNLTFALCFLSIIPLEKLFDYGGEQMAYFVGAELGDLVIVTLNNTVEATLAIILLTKCELRLLQATVVGVVLLHLLLVPGTAFLTGGAKTWEQSLLPHTTQLNHSLLMIGVLTLLIPSAFFAAIDRGEAINTIVNDNQRHQFLQMSRGLAVILLCCYVASRIYLHDPPGDSDDEKKGPDLPKALLERERQLKEGLPEVNPWFCIMFLMVTIAVMAVTAEMLVESIDHVKEQGNIEQEWFGLILLPIVSFAGDGAVAVLYFIRAAVNEGTKKPEELAKGRAIDLSVQFTLFWMPFFTLLGWWINKPLSMLFDFYEIALILGACFLVNYVTADAKTNWVEGFILVAFYIMIALCTWFYPGQDQIRELLACTSVAEAVANGGASEEISRLLL